MIWIFIAGMIVAYSTIVLWIFAESWAAARRSYKADTYERN